MIPPFSNLFFAYMFAWATVIAAKLARAKLKARRAKAGD